jgi:predicted HicB family RNase H-like nuclease
VMSSLGDALKIFDEQLRDDEEQFHTEFESRQSGLMTFLDQSIDDLRRLKDEYEKEFDYLCEENQRTCEDNRRQFGRFRQRLEEEQSNQSNQSAMIEEFRTNFPLRPQMLANIPRFDLQTIPLDSFIKREERSKEPKGSIGSSSHKRFVVAQ